MREVPRDVCASSHYVGASCANSTLCDGGAIMIDIPLLQLSGTFHRAIRADRSADVLAPPGRDSAGRYHRLGQPALYLTSTPDWAYIAVSGYMREDGLPRVIIPLEVTTAHVFDQRDEAACRALGIDREASNANWRGALAAGTEPPSWRNADAARTLGADGIIDRSRHIPGGWHVTLFRWNALGGPQVRVCGEAVVAVLSSSGKKWG
jgi:RES domain-containing protein